jgi:DNA-binding transcriptional MerR regulator
VNPPACFPGTRVPVSGASLLGGLFSVTNGVTLSQVCEITEVEPGTIQNWIKRGYVNPPVNRKYSKSQVARIILINMLRETLAIERIAKLLSYVNGDLLDRSDDIMDDSDIYECLCNILIPADEKEIVDIQDFFLRIKEFLRDFKEPYSGARERLELALKAMTCAWESANFKRYAVNFTQEV